MHLPGRGFHVVASATEHFEVCLGNIRQIAGVMLDQGDRLNGAQRHDYLRTIERKAGHLLEINGHLGDFAQVTLGRKPLARTKLLLSEVAGQAVEALTPLAASTRRLLVLAQGAGEPLISGDYRKLLNALCLLLRRSLDVAVPAAQILINIRSGHSESRLEIDVPVGTGSHPREPETRLPGDSPIAEGNGLTTAVVAQIIELHGGRLDILTSESHQRFIIALPLAK